MRYQVKDQGKLPAKFKWPVGLKIWFFGSLACFILVFIISLLFKNSRLIISLNDPGWLAIILIFLAFSIVFSLFARQDMRAKYVERKKILQVLSQGPKTEEEIHDALQPDPAFETKKKLKKYAEEGLVIACNNG